MVGTRFKGLVDLGADESFFRSQVSEHEIEGAGRRYCVALPCRFSGRAEEDKARVVEGESGLFRFFIRVSEEG